MRLAPGVLAGTLVLGSALLTAPTAVSVERPVVTPAELARPAAAPRKPAAELRPAGRRARGLRARRVVRGLDVPWDVQSLGGGRLLLTERDRRRLSVVEDGRRHTVRFPRRTVWSSSETGLMSLAVSVDFDESRRFYVCHGGFTDASNGDGHDVRVTSWRLGRAHRRATGGKVLLSGLPATSGRHGGCRLLLDRASGALYVGTGDAAVGTNPRDLGSLGGKVLRLDPTTGEPWPDNPFIGSDDPRTRYVLTYGHRNVQGLALRQDGSVWSVEHGSYRDDEVNLLVPGGDYGWHPVPGYDESVPMTDHSLPGTQIDARWSSGSPTLATSGAAWVRGSRWGRLEGSLAVAALKSSRLLFLEFDGSGTLVAQRVPRRMQSFGRLRSVTSLPGGALLVTTSNGDGRDSVVKVRP